MIRRLSILFPLALGIVTAFQSQAQEKIFVRTPAVFDKSAPIVDSVKAECAVDMLLGQHVYAKVSDKFSGAAQVRTSDEAGKGKVVELTILSVRGVGGGAWSGRKSITLRADLVQNNQVIATAVKQRSSSGGAFGGMSGTCAIMERIAVALGEDVTAWLASPAAASATVSAKPVSNEAGPTAAPKVADAPAATDVPSSPAVSQEEKNN